jgi:hypothetical protein
MSKFNIENMPSIADIKKNIAEKQAAKSRYKSTVDKTYFPFWDMPDGESAVVRIIPDENPENPNSFFLEKDSHTLSIDGNDRTVVCPKTFDRSSDCPICDLSQKYYREGDKEKGKYYWRYRTYPVRLLVLENPLEVEDENGDPVDYVGRVCNSTFRSQVIEALEEGIKDIDSPQPLVLYDFIIKKKVTREGDNTYNNFAFSRLATEPSPIPEEYAENIELIDFRDLLPDNPGLEKVQNFLDAHLGLAEFKYGGSGYSSSNDSSSNDESKTSVSATVAPKESSDVQEASSEKADGGSVTLSNDSSDDDMIANILKRTAG